MMTNRVYTDPLTLVWLHAAQELELRIERSTEVYASTDGKGVLYIADDASFDPDDSCAQMILHEICHWITEGVDAKEKADWGLSNTNDKDVAREELAIALQATLLSEFNLQDVLSPTTEFRVFYARYLQTQTLACDIQQKTLQEAIDRAKSAPFDEVLSKALKRTQTIVQQVREIAEGTIFGAKL